MASQKAIKDVLVQVVSMYSDWSDEIQPDTEIESLIDLLRKLLDDLTLEVTESRRVR